MIKKSELDGIALSKKGDNTKKEKFMTTKEIAEVIGVDVRTVQLAVNRLNFTKVLSQSTNGRPTMIFDEKQATLIKQEIAKHHNLTTRQIDSVQVKGEILNKVVTSFNEMDDNDLTVSVLAGMQKLLSRVDAKMEQKDKKIEKLQVQLDKSKEYRTVKWMESYCNRKFKWQELKRKSIEMGIEMHKVFDENYDRGVNSYHKDVWRAVYGDVANVIEDDDE